jgi:hypothetical protein
MSASGTLLKVLHLLDRSGFWGSAAAERRAPVPRYCWIFVEYANASRSLAPGPFGTLRPGRERTMSRLFGPMRQVGIVLRDIEKATSRHIEGVFSLAR